MRTAGPSNGFAAALIVVAGLSACSSASETATTGPASAWPSSSAWSICLDQASGTGVDAVIRLRPARSRPAAIARHPRTQVLQHLS
jgi:hypothetical protein